MIINLSSTNPEHYSKIDNIRTSIGFLEDVEYRINDLVLNTNFVILDDTDYLRFIDIIDEPTDQGMTYEILFDDADPSVFNPQAFVKYLDSKQIIKTFSFNLDRYNRLQIIRNRIPDKPYFKFEIECSRRVELALGFYNDPKPWQLDSVWSYKAKSAMCFDYNNVLYIIANTGNTQEVITGRFQETAKIVYKYIGPIRPNIPITYNKKPGPWQHCNTNELSNLSFELVDFQMFPIETHSPIMLTLEINVSD